MITVERRLVSWSDLARNPCNFAKRNLEYRDPHFNGPKFHLDWPADFDTKLMLIPILLSAYHYLGFQLLALKGLCDEDETQMDVDHVYFPEFDACLEQLWTWHYDTLAHTHHYRANVSHDGRWFRDGVYPMKLIHVMLSIEHTAYRRPPPRPILYLADARAHNNFRCILHDNGPPDRVTDDFKVVTGFSDPEASILHLFDDHQIPIIKRPQTRGQIKSMHMNDDGEMEAAERVLTVLTCEKIGYKKEADAILQQCSVIVDEQTTS